MTDETPRADARTLEEAKKIAREARRYPDAYLMEAYIKGEWSGNTPPMRSLNCAREHLIGQECLTGPGTARIVPLYRGEPLPTAGEGGGDE